MTVTITKDRLSAVLKTIGDLAKKQVLVGIPDGSPENTDKPITNAQIGYIQEKGSPAKNIPARPFLVPGVASVQDQCFDKLRDAASAALDGQPSGVNQGLTSAGFIAEEAVKEKINSNIQPELAESTLAARRARGVTRTNTLVDTAGMRNSVTHVIRDKS
ncbi:hypothetical protein [Caballeronia sp. KNU42]